MHDTMVTTRLRIPYELHDRLATLAQIHFHPVQQELVDMLQFSVDHNDEVMVSDRLLRLIYAKPLAYQSA